MGFFFPDCIIFFTQQSNLLGIDSHFLTQLHCTLYISINPSASSFPYILNSWAWPGWCLAPSCVHCWCSPFWKVWDLLHPFVYLTTDNKMQLYYFSSQNSREVFPFSVVSLQCTCMKIILKKCMSYSEFFFFLSNETCFPFFM